MEALVAGPALARKAQEEVQAGRASLLQELLARSPKPTAELVFEAATQGDSLAQQILAEAGSHLAYAIYLLAMAFDPQVVVLGGGLAQADGLFIEAIRSGVTRWLEQSPVFREILDLGAIRLSALQQDAGILGAAALVAVRRVAVKA